MCRWAAYRGDPIYLEELVSSPAHSLIEQSHCATRAKTATNGDGFGVAWYGDRPDPCRNTLAMSLASRKSRMVHPSLAVNGTDQCPHC